ncbi:hypothetical protein MBRA1_001831 [Malassezia brasiliensis]|uniref:Uncharacterized protein n=1 Tax=Malassezia brasiliensis TaxID=1821822 RepID=A0AAF0DWB1_9BASI|nr:hypothetical protein MBRA1_001831 [Malassezia brasiliensis]
MADAIRRSGFKYLHEVRGHRSCINALAFSRGSGQWMASGGDDMRIHVRDVFDYDPYRRGTSETSLYRTHARLLGHTSNIFSLSWSADNRFLFSGGNDQQVLCYDLNYGETPAYTVRAGAERRFPDTVVSAHEAGIREVSSHPTNPNLLLSSSDCGELFLVDLRLPDTHVAGYGYFPAQIASAQWNPNSCDGRTFAVATVCEPKAGVALFDMRKIFRDQTSYVDLDDSLVRYASELCVKRPSHGTAVRRMETTGAQFDPSGRFLVADVSLFHPVLYAIGSPEPLATMSSLQRYPHMSPCLPKPAPVSLDKYAGYRNSCTVKRGSFGFESQTGHLYYVTGSDDFRAYGWEIPPVEELVARRESMSFSSWLGDDKKGVDRVWFRTEDADNQPHVVCPPDLDTPSFTLEGSRSIVNSALCHPTLPMIATAGIERVVRLHFATPASIEHTAEDYDATRPKTRSRVRAVNTAAVVRAIRRSHRLGLDSDPESEMSVEDTETNGDVPPPSAEPGAPQRSPAAHGADGQRTAAELADEEAIALFDELLREEESRTLFSTDPYLDSSDEASSSASDTDSASPLASVHSVEEDDE